jgi:hypothetical protein
MNDLIFGESYRDGEVQMAKFDKIQDDLALVLVLTNLKQQ